MDFYIKACAMFVLNGLVEHLQHADSSSARQFGMQAGLRVRNVSGKLLWIQEKTADGAFSLQPVSTAYNVADIGTKTLSRQTFVLSLTFMWLGSWFRFFCSWLAGVCNCE